MDDKKIKAVEGKLPCKVTDLLQTTRLDSLPLANGCLEVLLLLAVWAPSNNILTELAEILPSFLQLISYSCVVICMK